MRKIFTLLAVGAMAMSAHAIDYYVIGGLTTGQLQMQQPSLPTKVTVPLNLITTEL